MNGSKSRRKPWDNSLLSQPSVSKASASLADLSLSESLPPLALSTRSKLASIDSRSVTSVKTKPPVSTSRNKQAVSEVDFSAPADVPEEYMWLFYQNYHLKRQIECQNETMRYRNELWSDLECVLEELSGKGVDLPDDLKRTVKQTRLKMKKNLDMRVEMENRYEAVRRPLEQNQRWTDKLPPNLLPSVQQQQSHPRKTELTSEKEKQLRIYQKQIQANEKRDDESRKAFAKLDEEISQVDVEYTKLKTNFSAANCVGFLDSFQARLQRIKENLNGLRLILSRK